MTKLSRIAIISLAAFVAVSASEAASKPEVPTEAPLIKACLLYTSDAADE